MGDSSQLPHKPKGGLFSGQKRKEILITHPVPLGLPLLIKLIGCGLHCTPQNKSRTLTEPSFRQEAAHLPTYAEARGPKNMNPSPLTPPESLNKYHSVGTTVYRGTWFAFCSFFYKCNSSSTHNSATCIFNYLSHGWSFTPDVNFHSQMRVCSEEQNKSE